MDVVDQHPANQALPPGRNGTPRDTSANRAYETAKGLGSEGPHAVRMVRVLALFLLAPQVVFLGATYVLPEQLGPLLASRVVVTALMAILFGSSFSPWFARYWREKTLALCGATIAVATLNGWFSYTTLPHFMRLVMLSVSCAALLPWNPFWQTALNLLCLSSFVLLSIHGLPFEPVRTWATFLSAIGLSEIIAVYLSRHRAQADAQVLALAESEDKFRRVFQYSTDSVAIASLPDMKFLDVNQELSRATGLVREEIVGKKLTDLDICADRGEFERLYKEFLQSGELRNRDADFRAKNGRVFPGLVSVARLEIGGQECALAIVRDITERKRAEEARALLAAIIRSAEDPILSSDLNWIVTSWNPGAEKLYGYSAAEIIGQKIGLMVPADQMAEVEQARARISRGERVVSYESKRTRKDGSVIDVSVRLSPVFDAAGSLVGISAIHRDITERRLAERAKELARSNAELEDFAYVVSHDLREPLHNVTAYVRLLAKDYQGKLGADADEYLRYALDGAGWMQTLIDDLLTYARATTDKKALEPTDFAPVVSQAIANLSAAIEEQRATVTYEPMPTVPADGRAMTQVFQNLIENALKFRGQEPPSVHLGAERRAGDWVFSVRDNGIGIDPAHTKHLFTIFHRLHSRREYPGSGIGLAICKKIVERHGGRIWVESEPGCGATFSFTIPA